MANTTNFGWETPDDTDLVKDGAAAIRTLGSAIDTSLVDLKGGTTGQILSKTSNTDMDFTWVTSAGDIEGITAGTGISGGGTTGTVTITNSMATAIDAKGDLIAGTGADAFSRLAVGTNDQVLTADSTTATGLKWAAVTTNKNYSLLNSGGTSLSGAQTVTLTGISNQDSLMIVVADASGGSNSDIAIRFNTDSTTKYVYSGTYAAYGTTYSRGSYSTFVSTTGTEIRIGNNSDGGGTISGTVFLNGCNTAGVKPFMSQGGSASGADKQMYWLGGVYTGSSAITSVSVYSSIGNLDAGTLYVYGAA